MNRKINLLYICDFPNSVHEYRFISTMCGDSGLNVHLATCEPGEFYSGITDLRNLVILRTPESHINSNIPGLRRALHLWRRWRFRNFLKKIITQYKIDIIHSGWLHWSSYDVAQTGFHPVLAMTYGSDVLDNPKIANPHNNTRIRKKTIIAAHYADAIYSDAEHVAITLVAMTGINRTKIHVFPQLGIDRKIFHPANPDLREKLRHKLNLNNRFVLLCVRNFFPVYAIEQLLTAFAKVHTEYPELYLICCGDGPLRPAMIQKAQKLGIETAVRFPGSIPNAELPSYYQIADLYVSTSLSDGTSLSLLEAMCCGLPPLVTDVPAIMEWVADGKNGFVVKRGNIDSISQGIRQAISNPAKLTEFKTKNLEIAETKIDLQLNYRKLGRLYRKLTGINPLLTE